MSENKSPAQAQRKKFAPNTLSQWRPIALDRVPQLPKITAADAAPILPDFDLWDCWPLQHEDGRTADLEGVQYWFFLSASRLPDPGHRHQIAKIRLLSRSNGQWRDLGDALPAELTPGHCEWAGSAVLHGDSRSVTLFFTASGRRGAGPSFEQRIFSSEGQVGPKGPGDWSEPCELFQADGTRYMLADTVDGKPGMIKAFRDPAWFRDPATGAAHLLFTGSAGWSDDAHNGVVGHAQMVDGSWQLGDPLFEAVGVNNELERPHILMRNGRYYLFWSTQRHTFSPTAAAGPNGLYAMVADQFAGPWRPVNGSGLVAANPQDEPSQCYSWWVTGEGAVWSFVDHWGMEGRSFEEFPKLLRSQFGGTPGPVFHLEFDGDAVRVA